MRKLNKCLGCAFVQLENKRQVLRRGGCLLFFLNSFLTTKSKGGESDEKKTAWNKVA